MSEADPLCVVTFLTRTRSCCFYATPARTDASGHLAPIQLPDSVVTQLDALGAKVAWLCVGPPHDLRVRGDAEFACEPVRSPPPEDWNRLVFV